MSDVPDLTWRWSLVYCSDVLLRRPLVDGPERCYVRDRRSGFLVSLLLRTGVILAGFYLLLRIIGRGS